MTTITIPKKVSNKELIAVPKEEYERFLFVSKIIDKDQLWFWTKQWQKKEAQADRDIRQKKLKGPFYSGKELVKALKSKK